MPPISGLVAGMANVPAPVRGALWMVAAAASFAALAALIRYLSSTYHPFQIVFFRNAFGLVFMMPWLVRFGLGAMKTQRLGTHTVRALFGLVSMLLWFSALALMPLAEAVALSFTTPLFATMGAALFLGETVRLRRWTATAVGFLGAMIILRPGAGALDPAAILVLTAAASMAGAALLIKSLAGTEPPNAIVTYMHLHLAPLSLVPALFVWRTPATAEAWLWLAALGATAALGHVFLTRAFAAADASAVLPFDFARLPFAALIGALAFQEAPDAWTWVGAAVIAAATVYIAHREARLGRPAVAATAEPAPPPRHRPPG